MPSDRFGGSRQAPAPLTEPAEARFTARFVSLCDECGFDIDPGDECTWADDRPVHLDCGGEG